MPSRRDAPPLTRGIVLRGVLFALAVALGAIAVWLIVVSTSQRDLRIGVLAGVWGALLGTFALFGGRRVSQSFPDDQPREVALRARAALDRLDDAELRSAFEARLNDMLRDIQQSVAREMAQLRSEISQLRGELVEKVGGQLRLERIETTRVIGSDLEALQHEVRQLKTDTRDTTDVVAEAVAEAVARTRRQVVEPVRTRAVSRLEAEFGIETDVVRTASRPVGPPTARQSLPPVEAVPVPGLPAVSSPGPTPANAGRAGSERAPAAIPPEPTASEVTSPINPKHVTRHGATRAAQPSVPSVPSVPDATDRPAVPAPAAEPLQAPVVSQAAAASAAPELTPGTVEPKVPAAAAAEAEQPAAPPAQVEEPAADPAQAEEPVTDTVPAAKPAAESAPSTERAADPAPAEPAPSETREPVPAEEPIATTPRSAEPASATRSQSGADPFAGLPRLSRFTDFELDAIEPLPADEYRGRRRRSDDLRVPAAAISSEAPGTKVRAEERRADGALNGRHGSSGDTPVENGQATPDQTGSDRPDAHRRRRRDDDPDDLLSRLLQREAAR